MKYWMGEIDEGSRTQSAESPRSLLLSGLEKLPECRNKVGDAATRGNDSGD